GEPALLMIRARDGLRSVFMPHMRVKMDAVPGMPTPFWFVANTTTAEMQEELGDAEFQYEIACTEVCGSGHFSMRKVITVLEPDEYQKWYNEQATFIEQDPDLLSNAPDEIIELAAIQI